MSKTYNEDFYGWSLEQAKLIRENKLSEIDIENVAEEIESLGKRDLRRVKEIVRWGMIDLIDTQETSHISKLKFCPLEFNDILEESPMLRALLENDWQNQYKKALRLALIRNPNLKDVPFPEICPFTLSDVIKNLEEDREDYEAGIAALERNESTISLQELEKKLEENID